MQDHRILISFSEGRMIRAFIVVAFMLGISSAPARAQVSTRTWVVDSSGLWRTATNWSGGFVPSGTGVAAVMDRPSGVYLITHDQSNSQVHSVNSAEPFELSGGNLNLVNESTFGHNLTLSGGNFTGSGNIVVNGTFDWRSGTFVQQRITANGGMIIGGAVTNTRTVINNGMGRMTGSISNQAGTIQNSVGATFDLQGDGAVAFTQGTNRFNNFGTFTKSAGTGRSRWMTIFSNAGTMNINSGTLALDAEFQSFFNLVTSFTSSGPITVAAGATLEFTGNGEGFHRLNAGSTLTGAGTVKFTTIGFGGAPQTIINDTYNITGATEFLAGTVTFNGPVLSLGSDVLTIAGGNVVNFNSNALTFTSINLSGSLGGSANITTGSLDWNGSLLAPNKLASLTVTGSLNMGGDFAHNVIGRTLINEGTAIWSGTGGVLAGADHVFDNRAAFEIQNDASYTRNIGANPLFKNSGSITKSSAGVTTFALPVSSSGTIDTGAGTINFTDSLTLTDGNLRGSGPINSSGPFTIQNTVTKQSTGTLNISGPQTHPRRAALILEAGETNFISSAGTAPNNITAAIANLTITVAGPAMLTFGADQYLRNLIVPFTNPGSQSVDLNSPAAPGSFRLIHLDPIDLPAAKASLYAAIANANRAGAADPTDGIYDSSLASHPSSRIGIAALIDIHDDPYLLIRPTRIGDLNLDGTVTIADFLALASHFGSPGTWQDGDINYDGTVSIADFLELAGNFNSSYSGESWPISAEENALLSSFASSIGAAPIVIPEPASLALLCSIAIALSRKRAQRPNRRH
jgi:hypothetical protein